MFLGIVGSKLRILPLRFRVWIVYHTKKSYVAYDGAWAQGLMHFGLTSCDVKKDWKRFPLAFYDSLEEAYLCVAEDMEILAEVDGAGGLYYFHLEEEEEHSLLGHRGFD